MLFGIDSTYFWLILAVVLSVFELSTVTLVSIWFVIGAMFAFGVSFISENIVLQTVVFIVVSGASLAFTRPLVKKYLVKKPVATNRDMLLGTKGVITQDVLPDKKGRVKSGDIDWLAQSDVYIPKGTVVKIEDIQGATLKVSPMAEIKQ